MGAQTSNFLPLDYGAGADYGTPWGPYKIYNLLFYADILNSALSFGLKRPMQYQNQIRGSGGNVNPVLSPTLKAADFGGSYSIVGIGFRIPKGITVVTNTNKLKVSTGVANAGPLSAQSASATFAEEEVKSTYDWLGGTPADPFLNFTTDQTLALYSVTTAGGVAGASMSAATNVTVPVVISVIAESGIIIPRSKEISGILATFE